MPSGKSTIYSEDDLILALQNQDRQAYEYLYRRYSRALLGIILHTVESEETANDVLQEVFVKIWKNIRSYNPQKGRLFTWMLNIARNAAIDFKRSKQSRKEEQNQNIEEVVYTIETENKYSIQTDTIGLRNSLQKLNKEQQLLLEYVYFKGYTQEEASQSLKIPLGTVKTRIRAAIQNLRKEFTA